MFGSGYRLRFLFRAELNRYFFIFWIYYFSFYSKDNEFKFFIRFGGFDAGLCDFRVNKSELGGWLK